MTILVTGGAGFIGSNFILDWLEQSNEHVVNIDKLTYAGNMGNLSAIENDERHVFAHGDICDAEFLTELFERHKPRAIVNFAAESHVDRSIHGPEDFIQANIVGTFRLLEVSRAYWGNLQPSEKQDFRFLHVSTDEVFGSLAPDAPAFKESNRYEPNSPYSASKASADHLVRSYYHTYGLPVLTTNCSNNYGAYQFPEKLIPLIIHNALAGKSLPIYGDGQQVRDWLFVGDHCSAIRRVLEAGKPSEVYNVGGLNEMANIEIVNTLCELLDEMVPENQRCASPEGFKSLITYVKDRPGHDRRYAIDATKIESELGWKPAETFDTGIRKTVRWYLDNQDWVAAIVSGEYRNWVERQYS